MMTQASTAQNKRLSHHSHADEPGVPHTSNDRSGRDSLGSSSWSKMAPSTPHHVRMGPVAGGAALHHPVTHPTPQGGAAAKSTNPVIQWLHSMLFLMFLKLRMGAPLLRLALSVVIFIVVYLILSIPEVFAASVTRETSYSYDPNTGLLIQEVVEPNSSALSSQTDYIYDAFGNKVSATTTGFDIDSRTTSWAYDQRGQNALGNTNALGQSDTSVFSLKYGVAISQTGPNGLTTTWEYDSFGRRVSEIRADGNRTIERYSYCSGVANGTETCPNNAVYLVETKPLSSDGSTQNGPWVKRFFDSHGRTVATDTQGFEGGTIRQEIIFDQLGHETQTSLPYFLGVDTPVWNTRAYDVTGRIVSIVLADGSLTTSKYSGLTESVVNDLGQIETTIKNQRGEVAYVVDAVGNLTSFTYGPFGNRTSTQDSDGNLAQMIYDTLGRRTNTTDPDLGSWSYTYNVLGEVLTQTDAKGQTSISSYDKLGRLVSLIENDLSSSWSYDTAANGIGKLASTSTSEGYQKTVVYDNFGRPTQTDITIDSTTETIATSYNSDGRVSNVVYPSGFSVDYIYTSLGYTSKLRNSATLQVYWEADELDAHLRLTQHTLGNGITINHDFDPNRGFVTSINSGGVSSVADFSYVYDTIGNLTQRSDVVESLTENFSYDNLNRLTQYSIHGGSSKTVQYDDLGNITYKSDVGTYSYPSPGSARPHAVSAISGITNTSFVYDANGSMLSGGGRTLTWTSSRKVKSIALGANNVTFSYNSENQRSKKTDGQGTTYYYRDLSLAGLLVEKHIGSSVTQWNEYLFVGGDIVGQHFSRSNSTQDIRYFVKDHLGSIALILDEVGGVVERLSYDAWGKRRFSNGADDPTGSIVSQTNRGFTGHEMLDQVGIINMNGRIYDPQIGRFMSADPYIHDATNSQDLNRYSYVHNNPLSYKDENGYGFFKKLGRFFKRIVKPLLALVAAVTLQVYLAPIISGVISSQFVAGAVTAGISGGVSNVILTGRPKSFLVGFGQAALTFGIADKLGHGASFAKPGKLFTKTVAHGVVGGAFSEVRGGSFKSGFIAAGFSSLSGAIDLGSYTGNFVKSTVAGGFGSVLGGGKFADGAVTASFVFLYNETITTFRRGREAHDLLQDEGSRYGYDSERFVYKGNGRRGFIDLIDPENNIYELKANRIDQIAMGRAQLLLYVVGTDRNGSLIGFKLASEAPVFFVGDTLTLEGIYGTYTYTFQGDGLITYTHELHDGIWEINPFWIVAPGGKEKAAAGAAVKGLKTAVGVAK